LDLQRGFISLILRVEDLFYAFLCLILQAKRELLVKFYLIIDNNSKLILFLGYSRYFTHFSKFDNNHDVILWSIDSNHDIDESIKFDQGLEKLDLDRSLSGLESIQKSVRIINQLFYRNWISCWQYRTPIDSHWMSIRDYLLHIIIQIMWSNSMNRKSYRIFIHDWISRSMRY